MLPHRDPQLAATERLVQLEDEVRALRGALGQTAPRAKRRTGVGLVLGLALLAIPAVAAYGWWASQPASQTVLPTNAGLSVTVVFRSDVDAVRFETADGKTQLTNFAAAVSGVSLDDHTPVSVRSAGVLLKDSLLSHTEPTRLRVHYEFWGIPRSALIEIDSTGDARRFMQSALEGIPQWVAFREYDGKLLVYFTTVLAYKPAIQAIRWGIDDAPLERTVRFLKSNDTGIDASDEVYTSVPHGTDHVRVQLEYRDGSHSEVRTILRRDATIP